MTTKNITTTNITNAEISTLRREANQHGDYLMGVICDLAIDGEIDTDDYTVLDDREVRMMREMTADEAVQACVDAINKAQAQRS